MPNYSLGEIDALARKATRGAGYSWGIAEEAGKSVRWLSAYGFSGAENLAEHLKIVANKQQDYIPNLINVTSGDKVFENDDGQLCSLYCGALINDFGHHLEARKTLIFRNMLSPLLALPSAGRIAEAYNISVSLLFAETTVICKPDGIIINDTPHLLGTFHLDTSMDVNCSLAEHDFDSTHFPSPLGRPIEQESLEILEKFANKTYAPATEESRLRGAG